MQLLKAERENFNAHLAGHGAPSRFSEKIGSSVFTVNVFQDAKRESLEEKILRMMKNDLKTVSDTGTIRVPQAYRLPERGSL